MKITQARFSESIKFFWPKFQEYWKVDAYCDTTAPALFMGVYRQEDVDAIKRHEGFRLVRFTGADIPMAKHLLGEDMTVWCLPGEFVRLPATFRKREFQAVLKDYSAFQPVPLGDKVYVYMGRGNYNEYFRGEIIDQIQARIPYQVIRGVHGTDIDTLRTTSYLQAFINLRLNPMVGGMTAEEMAYMGRYTISNRVEPWYIGWKDTDDIVRIIKEQAVYVGQTRGSLITDYHGDWRDINLWI